MCSSDLRGSVPPAFAPSITLAAHQRAADYTLAKGRFGLLGMAFGAAVLLGWTLLGGVDALNVMVRDAIQPRFGSMAYQLALLTCFALIGSVLDLPFELYSTFRIEQRADHDKGSEQRDLVGHVAQARLNRVTHRGVERAQAAEQRPAQQHGGAERHAQQAETTLRERVVGGALVRGERDRRRERRWHGVAVCGHMAHLTRREPELDEQRGEQRGRKHEREK